MAESEISRINRNLEVRFYNMDTFTSFIDEKYGGKQNEFERFEKDLGKALNTINDYCNGIFVEKITAETVRIWHSRINYLYESIKSISYSINMTMLDYEAHVDTPEKFFLKQMDEEFDFYGEDEERFKKYSNYVAEFAEDYKFYNKYIKICSSVFNTVLGQFQCQFANYVPVVEEEKFEGERDSQIQSKITNFKPLASKEQLKGESESQNNTYTSFNYSKYSGKERWDKIKLLFDYMKKENLIDRKTKSDFFIALFLDAEIHKPVNWTGNIGHLGYFIICLKEHKLLADDDEIRIWEKAKKCFLIKGEAIIKNNLKTNTDPKNKMLIDKALKILK